MAQLLVVMGATGQQGGSVIEQVLGDPELKQKFKIRGVTRDTSKPNSQALVKRGVEMVQGDVDDAASIRAAFKGAHFVFAVTVTVYDGKTKEREVSQGRALADAAVAEGVGYYIFSTLPNAFKLSGGKITGMGHFDGKEEAEEYIRTLPLRSAFVAPGSFMANFHDTVAPYPTGDGSYALSNFVAPDTKLPLIHTAGDTGKWVAAILADPARYEGQVLSCATDLYSMQDIVDAMSKSTGKKVGYNQLPEEVWKGFLPPAMAEHIADMFRYFEQFGYYGPDTAQKVRSSAAQARGRLTTLDEYLAANPLKLQ